MFTWLKHIFNKNQFQFRSYDERQVESMLKSQFKYLEIPELFGKTIHISSFDTLEQDLIAALKSEYPYIKGLWHKDKNWCAGTDLVKFWITPMFQVNLLVEGYDIPSGINIKNMLDLDFVKLVNGEIRINKEVDLDESEWRMFIQCLEEERSNLYMHLFLHHSEYFDKSFCFSPDIYKGHEFFDATTDSENIMERTQSLCLHVGKSFFPRKMYVIDACYTNIPSSILWSTKYPYPIS